MKTTIENYIYVMMKNSGKVAIRVLPFLLFIFISSFTRGQQQSQTFNSSGTWTCPQGVAFVDVQCWGGGGGGGGSSATSSGGSGGGSGAYVKKTAIPVTPGTVYTVVVGTGGTGGSGFVTGIVAGKGGQSYFDAPGIVSAGGGCGALGDKGSAGAGACSNNTTSTCFALMGDCNPSIAIMPNVFNAGNNGSTGTSSQGAKGGSAPGGGAGGAAKTTDGIGNSGIRPGGGGGGGYRTGSFNVDGGAGGGGRVIISWTGGITSVSSAGTGNSGSLLSIYPNPAGEQLFIRCSHQESRIKTKILIFNMLGEQMMEENAKQLQNESLDIRKLPAGIYLLQAETEQGKFFVKFVKQ